MKKKDVLELRRRFTKDCTISRLAGCYVDCNKHKVLSMNENFLNLKEEEFYKYLEIAKKTLGGAVGNNLLELDFPSEEEEPGGKQQFLRGLRESDLEQDELLERLYDLIIEKFSFTGNYLILVYRDNYDIMTRTTDNLKLDESEEVYEYLLVSICPVDLSKPGLGYRTDENRIGARLRDWVVQPPELGFLFPAFDDRSSDIHKVDYFVKDPKDTHPDFIEDVLGCSVKRTSVQKRQAFNQIVTRAYNNDEEKAADAIMEIQESINSRVVEDEDSPEALKAPIVIDDSVIAEILEESGIKEAQADVIRREYGKEFSDELPTADNMLDAKAIKANAPVKREKELIREVIELKGRLQAHGLDTSTGRGHDTADEAADAAEDVTDGLDGTDLTGDTEPDVAEVVLRVTEDKAGQIREQVIDDRRYILIPVEDDDTVVVNGRQL